MLWLKKDMDKECTFCKIVSGELPSNKVYTNSDILAFAPLEKDILSKGHLLIIPKKHFSDIFSIPSKELLALLKGIKEISNKLKSEMGVEGVNILHASGKSAQQSVFHFHFHLIPRYNQDGLDLWPKTSYKEGNYLDVYKKMKDVLN